MQATSKYHDLVNEKQYLRLLSANLANRFGDSIDALVFSWMVYEITQSASWSALIIVFNSLPTILFMSFTGVVVERYNQKIVMAVTDISRALLVLLVMFSYLNGILNPFILAVVTFTISTLEAFRIPAGLGIFPAIVPREKYVVATSLNQSGSNIAQLLGSAAFGVLVVTLGVGWTMFVNFALFFLSGLLIMSITYQHQKVEVQQTFFTDFKDGINYFLTDKKMILICIFGCSLNFLLIPYSSLNVPYVVESLGQGESLVSLMSVAFSCGSLLGTFMYPNIDAVVKKMSILKFGAVVIVGVYLGFVLLSGIQMQYVLTFSLIAVMFMFGVAIAFMQVSLSVFFVQYTSQAYRSRMGGITNALFSGAIPVSSFIVSFLATFMTVNQIFLLFSFLSVIMFTVLFSRKEFKEMNIDGEK